MKLRAGKGFTLEELKLIIAERTDHLKVFKPMFKDLRLTRPNLLSSQDVLASLRLVILLLRSLLLQAKIKDHTCQFLVRSLMLSL
ncbi:hypothetical protein REPUB_Repub14bG0052900 [Reevesia pubescens]